MENKTEQKQKILKFPKGFYWGAATSAHQVEGGNHNDWTEWEKENAKRLARESESMCARWMPAWNEIKNQAQDPKNYISERACDHYNLYEKDFDIAKSLGHNAHRLSIEWSRVEPEEGKFDEKEIEHYRQVIMALRERGIEPFVTLWHWTLPLWISRQGGWTNKKTIKYFSRYVEKMARIFEGVKYWLTLNEPDDVYTFFSYGKAVFPPAQKSFIKAFKVLNNLIKAHRNSYAIIHSVNASAQVGFANNIIFFESGKHWSDKIIKTVSDYFWNFWFFKKTMPLNDFIGLNYYHHNRIDGRRFNQNSHERVTDLGWDICPEGIYFVLKKIKRYNLPVYITENGLADAEDNKRGEFIKDHLYWIHKAIKEGIDVRGYLYWSLLDNFEWDKGFWPRFGLVEVDYNTLERRIRPSAYTYAEICKNNELKLESKIT